MGTCRAVSDAIHPKILLKNDLCQARQIHQRQVQHMRREYLEVDRLPIDALVVSGDP